MSCKLTWIFLLILQAFVTSLPMKDRYDISAVDVEQKSGNTPPEIPKYGDASDSNDKQVISVRVTSSVAVGRGKDKSAQQPPSLNKHEPEIKQFPSIDEGQTSFNAKTMVATEISTNSSPKLLGANIEYIKQLNAKKESRDNTELVNHFHMTHGQQSNENEFNPSTAYDRIDGYNKGLQDIPTARKVPSTSDANHFQQKQIHEFRHTNFNAATGNYGENNLRKAALSDPSVNYGLRINLDGHKNVANDTVIQMQPQHIEKQATNNFFSRNNNYETDDSIAESSIKSVEFAPSTGPVPTNYVHNLSNRQLNEEQNNPGLSTLTFNIVHDPTRLSNGNVHSDPYITSNHAIPDQQQYFASPRIYSKPSQIYSEPSKFYSEPAKIYSEPSKIYSEPSKVYSEPAKIYSEPAKFYSQPASLHLDQNIPNIPPNLPPNYSTWQRQPSQQIGSITMNTTPITTKTNAYPGSQTQIDYQSERNYELEENHNKETDYRSPGVPDSSTEKCKEDSCKVGYVVEGRQYKKYRVEERTSDGFIVGEYGVVRNEDGALRGVRYTADSDASPRLIHDALMKFLQLK